MIMGIVSVLLMVLGLMSVGQSLGSAVGMVLFNMGFIGLLVVALKRS